MSIRVHTYSCLLSLYA